MEMTEAIRAALKELVLPELGRIMEENKEIKAALALTNRRLDDIDLHLADLSRRIDQTNERINHTNGRIDQINERMNQMKDQLNGRIDQLSHQLNNRINQTNNRLDTLFEVVVHRDEHFQLAKRLAQVEREVADIKQKLAA